MTTMNNYPAIDGTGVRLLQVEYTRNKAWSPDAVVAAPVSSHAVQVRRRILDTAPAVTLVTPQEANAYIQHSLMAPYSRAAVPATWDVENHSYGAASAFANQALGKMVERVERDNVVVVAAHPNSTSEIANPLWFRSDHVLVVGGADKDFGWTTWGEKVRVPHIRGTHKDSSIACAEVAAVAALVIQAIRQVSHGLSPAWVGIREILVKTAVNGAVNADAALDYVLGASPIELAVEPEPAPEPAPAPDMDLSNGDQPPEPPSTIQPGLSYEDLEQQLDAAKADVDSLSQQVDIFEAENKRLTTRVSELVAEVSALNAKLVEAEARALDSKTENDALRRDAESDKARIAELEGALSSAGVGFMNVETALMAKVVLAREQVAGIKALVNLEDD